MARLYWAIRQRPRLRTRTPLPRAGPSFRAVRSAPLRSAKRAKERLKDAGIDLKDVYIGSLRLPAEFEKGRMALLQESQEIDRKEATLRLKKQEIEQGGSKPRR